MKKFISSYPELVKEWHPTKNGELTPSDFTHGSNKKVWWSCPKGHDYDSVIYDRTKKVKPTGCRYCAGKSPTKENNLLVLFPDVAKEWHPTKNGELTPYGFTPSSHKKVWWKCPKGHDYDSVISGRTGKDKPRGCRYCAGRKKIEE